MTFASAAGIPPAVPPDDLATTLGGHGGRGRGRWTRVVLRLGIFLVMCQVLLVAAIAHQWREHELHEAENQLRSDAIGLSEHALQALNTLDAMSLSLAESAAAAETAWFDTYDDDITRWIEDQIDSIPHIRGAVTIAPSGMSVNDGFTQGRNPLDLSDRAYFQVHRDHPGHSLYLGDPLRSRATGTWFLPATRAVIDADGDLLGVVLLTVEPQYFSSFYARLNVQPISRAIVSVDGILLSAYSPAPGFDADAMLGHPMALPDDIATEGVAYRDFGLLSPVPSLVRLARVPGWDWVIVVEMPIDVALEDWYDKLWALGELGALSVLVLIGAFAWIGRHEGLLGRAYDTISRQNADLEDHYLKLKETNRHLAESRNQCDLQRQEMEKLAMTDALTGISNRRHFTEIAGVEVCRARRYRTAISLIALDIDRFKAVNDAFGHAVGDEVLRAIAAAVAAQLRCSDMIARIGGEEFAVMLPQTDLHAAARMAQRLRIAVARQTLPACPDGTTVTISLGVAEWLPTEPLIDATLARADRALYQAKAEGRNRVCVLAAEAAAPQHATTGPQAGVAAAGAIGPTG